MFESNTSLRQWSAQVQSFVVRQFDQLAYYLQEMDAPARLVVLLTVIVFCYIALQGSRPKPAY